MEKNQGFATKQIHVGKVEIPGIAPLATPIFQTSTFEFDSRPLPRAQGVSPARSRAITTPASAIPTPQRSVRSSQRLSMPKQAWQWQAAWAQ